MKTRRRRDPETNFRALVMKIVITQSNAGKAENVPEQLITSILERHFYYIQLDDSTNITNLSNLLGRCENNVRLTIKEGFVFCKSLTVLLLRPFLT